MPSDRMARLNREQLSGRHCETLRIDHETGTQQVERGQVKGIDVGKVRNRSPIEIVLGTAEVVMIDNQFHNESLWGNIYWIRV